jgi:hypothetical protein
MAQVVRRERWDPGCGARVGERRPEAVAAEAPGRRCASSSREGHLPRISSRVSARASRFGVSRESVTTSVTTPSTEKKFQDRRSRLSSGFLSGPAWIRTRDQRIMSPLL